MFKADKLLIHKKILFLFTVLGSCGGLYIGVMHFLCPETGLWWFFANFLIFLILGMFLGIIALNTHKSERKMLLEYDKNGDLLISKQKIYLLTPAIIAATYLINLYMGIDGRLTIAVLTGGVFMLGLSGGIYGHFSINSISFLGYELIPLTIGSVYIFISDDSSVVTIIWILLFMYLLSGLLTISSVSMHKNLFDSKGINIRNSTRIKWFNYAMVTIFSVFCIVAVFIRNILKFFTFLADKASAWIFTILVRVTEWLTRDSFEYKPETAELPELGPDKISIMALIILVMLAILVFVLIITIIITAVKLINWSPKHRIKLPKSEPRDFKEDIEFIKFPKGFVARRSYKYTKKGLSELEKIGEIIRYLYGFILERLHRKKYLIKLSDTPGEIYQIFLNSTNGKIVDELGFSELTEKYRMARYGNKRVCLDGDVVEIAKKYEKVISDICVE